MLLVGALGGGDWGEGGLLIFGRVHRIFGGVHRMFGWLLIFGRVHKIFCGVHRMFGWVHRIFWFLFT